MLKKINRILRLVGLNLVRAKRKKTSWQKVPPYTPQELQDAAVPRNCEWQGKTHYVGDDCPGGHEEWETSGGTTPEQNEARFDRPTAKQPTSDNNITGPTS